MLKLVHTLFLRLFAFCMVLTKPYSQDKDLARREFILNLLLLTAIVLSVVSCVVSISSQILDEFKGVSYTGINPVVLLITSLIFISSYILSKIGKSQFVAFVFIMVYFVGATYTSYRWGIDIPLALLTYSLIIVMSGILINARFALLMTFNILVVLGGLLYLRDTGVITPENTWRSENPDVSDFVVYSVIFLIMFTVSWLFNREMEKSLKRARESEKALKQERDSLEIKVEERTKELKESQIAQMSQVYRFAELGRLASGIFHDLASPITLVSLSLESLNEKSKLLHEKEVASLQEHLKRALMGTKRLESFIQAARKHIQNQDVLQVFSLRDEIQQALQILHPKARKNSVSVMVEMADDIHLRGNPIKFHQLIINFISNAIDAYLPLKKDTEEKRLVNIGYTKEDTKIMITIQDWGMGIPQKILPHIFEPLFTTKSADKGTGLGLSICKDIIQEHFHGTITVKSKEGEGTTFTLEFPYAEKTNML